MTGISHNSFSEHTVICNPGIDLLGDLESVPTNLTRDVTGFESLGKEIQDPYKIKASFWNTGAMLCEFGKRH